MAGPSSTGNYARAGASVGRDAQNLFKITRQNAPDMSAIVQEAAKRKAESEMKGHQIAANTLTKGITEVTKTANYKQGIEAEAKLKGAKRKAGVLAAAGGYLGTGIGGLGESGRKKREVGANDDYYTKRINEYRTKVEEIKSTPFEMPGSTQEPSTKSDDPAPAGSTPQPGSTPKPASTPKLSSSGGTVSQSTVYQGLIDRGMSPDNARIGSAIMMGESGGNAGIDTVQSGLDPNQTNEFSVGLFQINTQAHGDKLKRRGLTNDDLRNPEHNLDLTVEVFNEAGGSWKPWGAYTNGSYQQYLN